MKVFQNEIFPFNIAVARYNEDLSSFTYPDGSAVSLESRPVRPDVLVFDVIKKSDNGRAYPYVLVLMYEKIQHVGLLCHETFHTAMTLGKHIGAYNPCDANEEFYAYVQGYVAECIDKANKELWA